MSRKKSKVHYVTLTLRFDKPCGVGAAIKAARECIADCGSFYPSWDGDDKTPEEFKVTGARRGVLLRRGVWP